MGIRMLAMHHQQDQFLLCQALMLWVLPCKLARHPPPELPVLCQPPTQLCRLGTHTRKAIRNPALITDRRPPGLPHLFTDDKQR